jgi:hypothetical protein
MPKTGDLRIKMTLGYALGQRHARPPDPIAPCHFNITSGEIRDASLVLRALSGMLGHLDSSCSMTSDEGPLARPEVCIEQYDETKHEWHTYVEPETT